MITIFELVQKKNFLTINLRSIANSDYMFLYKILKKREPIRNISHRKMPSFTEHIKFVKSKPYSKWYIVELGRAKIGSVYLTKDNEIGIQIKNEYLSNEVLQAIFDKIKSLHPKHRYFVNIAPKNTKLINFFKKNGFTLRQVTYAIDYFDLD
jgi:RimJ/RimL family protein N-acetyltransferase